MWDWIIIHNDHNSLLWDHPGRKVFMMILSGNIQWYLWKINNSFVKMSYISEWQPLNQWSELKITEDGIVMIINIKYHPCLLPSEVMSGDSSPELRLIPLHPDKFLFNSTSAGTIRVARCWGGGGEGARGRTIEKSVQPDWNWHW